MARDECIDCEQQFPGGEGLIGGRCLNCHTAFKKRQQQPEAPVEPEPPPEPERKRK